MTHRKNRHSPIQHLISPSNNNTTTDAPVQRTVSEAKHHNHHHHGIGGVIRSIGSAINHIEKPVEHVATRSIGAVEHTNSRIISSFNKTMGSLSLPLILVGGGILVLYISTKK